MSKVLVLYAHPRADRSEVNANLAAVASNIQGVTVVDLYAEYPRFDIDVDREQARLLDHDVIIFQHPVYWYSSPSILKEWQDLVLKYGFAYGHNGTALKGKIFFNAVTAGAGQDSYSRDGHLSNELRDFFKPFQYMARLCHMTWLPPFAVFRAGHTNEDGTLDQYAKDYGDLLDAFVADQVDIPAAGTLSQLNDNPDKIIRRTEGAV